MFDWLKKRRLSADARKKLMIVTARAEEALVETHVANILDLLEALGDEVDIERAVELYLDRIPLEESLATAVTTRLLARIEGPRSARHSERYRHAFRQTATR